MSTNPQRRPLRTRILYNAIIFSVFLGIAEGVLRLVGFTPGFVGANPWEWQGFTLTDSLEISKQYYTDEEGVFRANPYWFRRIGVQVNDQGYRTPPFSQILKDSTRRNLLFIGDSFTWGASADPIENAFVDLIDRETPWDCINLGIPGTGPNQYAVLAEKYIPIFKPEVTCVIFYMANDVLYHIPPMVPNKPPHHITNAGWLNAWPDGKYIETPQKAYDYLVRRFSIPQTTLFNRICAKTAIGTLVWKVMAMAGLVQRFDDDIQADYDAYQAQRSPVPLSDSYLHKIQKICEANGSRFYLFVIPIHTRLHQKIEKSHPGLFIDLKYYLDEDLQKEDYNDWPDGHFNLAGHRKFAEFIKKTLGPPPPSRPVFPLDSLGPFESQSE